MPQSNVDEFQVTFFVLPFYKHFPEGSQIDVLWHWTV
jgi:hypothetical protein